jgi:TolB protein
LKARIFLIAALAAVTAGPNPAQRKPVLPQIDLPHPYYFREMYLPQLTSGPSSVSWSPDSKELVYSMAGSLWRQKIDEQIARQVTDGPGYDYQPDWSPDGRNVVYCSYQKDAVELWLLNLTTGKTEPLTNSGAVNVEPRWSPDGKRIVFVSTAYHKRFHIFRADVNGENLQNVVRLTGETRSELPRYYYSAFDHEISPVWSRDGKEILFVSNRGHIHGTGGFWRMRAEPGAEAREIHYEETNWKARPDFSPDGSRMVYSSYLGREWHQLWVMPANGGDAFPMSYGDWDETSVRWSPDGEHLAFISNRADNTSPLWLQGNTQLWLQGALNGKQEQLKIEGRLYVQPHVPLSIRVLEGKRAASARVSVTDEAGRFHAPGNTWIYADDSYDRAQSRFEPHYFDVVEGGAADLDVPRGKIRIEVMTGLEKHPETRTIETGNSKSIDTEFRLKPLSPDLDPAGHWVSGDLHVHMNYGGTYRNDLRHLQQQARAEGLDIINELIVNKEQRFPDSAHIDKPFDDEEIQNRLQTHGWEQIVRGQEFHTSYWGHRGLLNMEKYILLPGYAGYPNTAAACLYPMNADVYDMAHAQGALVGAVHPFDDVPDPFAKPAQRITDELPVDVALGKLDYMEIVGFSDHRSTAAVWYRLLNLGFRIPAGAGTDAMADYASLRGPVGLNRVYAWAPDWRTNLGSWFEALKKGRTFATNGPLLDFSLDGQAIGGELKFDEPRSEVPFNAKLRSIVPVDHLEVICNGRIAQTLTLNAARDSVEARGTLPLKESGWCVLRASSDKAEYPVLDNYVYATTSPIYVTIGGKVPRSPEDANYFAAWIERVMDATSHYPDWNSVAEKDGVLKELAQAKGIFEKLR